MNTHEYWTHHNPSITRYLHKTLDYCQRLCVSDSTAFHPPLSTTFHDVYLSVIFETCTESYQRLHSESLKRPSKVIQGQWE